MVMGVRCIAATSVTFLYTGGRTRTSSPDVCVSSCMKLMREACKEPAIDLTEESVGRSWETQGSLEEEDTMSFRYDCEVFGDAADETFAEVQKFIAERGGVVETEKRVVPFFDFGGISFRVAFPAYTPGLRRELEKKIGNFCERGVRPVAGNPVYRYKTPKAPKRELMKLSFSGESAERMMLALGIERESVRRLTTLARWFDQQRAGRIGEVDWTLVVFRRTHAINGLHEGEPVIRLHLRYPNEEALEAAQKLPSSVAA